jgi:hypothetical protein
MFKVSFSSSSNPILQYIFYSVGGLRYHGMAPLISHVYELGFMEAMAIPQIECFRGNCLPPYGPAPIQVSFMLIAELLMNCEIYSQIVEVGIHHPCISCPGGNK